MSCRIRRVVSIAAIAAVMSGCGVSAVNASETSDMSSSSEVKTLYNAKKTFGVNWNGWQLVINNTTQHELNLVGAKAHTSVEVIHPGEINDKTRGTGDWSIGYFPDPLSLDYVSGDLVEGWVRYINLDFIQKEDGVVIHNFSCGLKKKVTEDAWFKQENEGCKFTRHDKTKQIEIEIDPPSTVAPWIPS